MNINDFIKPENISKENPFEKCDVIRKFDLGKYSEMLNIAASMLFSENGIYRSSIKLVGIRTAIMSVVLGLEIGEEKIDTNNLFNAMVISGIYKKFKKNVAEKIIPDFKSLEESVELYIDDLVQENLVAADTDNKVINAVTKLLASETFGNIVDNFVEISDKIEKAKDGEVDTDVEILS